MDNKIRKPISYPTEAELLWTNPTPNSSFAPQTISLNLTEFDGVIVIIKSSDVSDLRPRICGYVPKGTYSGNAYVIAKQYDTGIGIRKVLAVTDSGVQFDVGKNNGNIDKNDQCIPLKIYGVKGMTLVNADI